MDNPLYKEDLENCLNSAVNLHRIQNKTILITGATGMIGSFIVDALMYGNATHQLHCTVIAMGRNSTKAHKRFSQHWNHASFSFIEHDVNKPLPKNIPQADLIIHSASTTHPIAYATEPIATITTNIFGTLHLLNYIANQCPNARMVLTSSVEIYGQNRGDTERFTEEYCGYINCNTLRAGYPESKRLSEALCQAYAQEKGIDYVSVRLPRTYGPTMLMSDTKALSQFIKKGLIGENIILKSEGNQFFSYAYVADAVSGLLSIMLSGNSNEAYNIAAPNSDITLRELAQLVAEYSNTKLIFELPDAKEKAGYSTATKATLDSSKIKKLGWEPAYDIRTGLKRTLEILSINPLFPQN